MRRLPARLAWALADLALRCARGLMLAAMYAFAVCALACVVLALPFKLAGDRIDGLLDRVPDPPDTGGHLRGGRPRTHEVESGSGPKVRGPRP